MTISRREAVIALLERLPTAAVSRVVGRLCRVPLPRAVREPLWRGVASRLGMELSEAALAPADMPSFDALFTRPLIEGARPIEAGPGALVSPCDGRITWNTQGRAELPIKGESGSLANWLGSEELPWQEPWVAVVYLSPADYHRVHAPIDGVVERVTYTPGALIPVNPKVAGDGRAVFGRNERVTCWLATEWGPVAVALVGAMCVGGISLSFDDLRSNRSFRRRPVERELAAGGAASPTRLAAGDELGTFHMGSSVIIVWEAGRFEASPALVRGRAVKMGQRLGAFG